MPTALLFSESIKVHVLGTKTQATEQLTMLKEAKQFYVSHDGPSLKCCISRMSLFNSMWQHHAALQYGEGGRLPQLSESASRSQPSSSLPAEHSLPALTSLTIMADQGPEALILTLKPASKILSACVKDCTTSLPKSVCKRLVEFSQLSTLFPMPFSKVLTKSNRYGKKTTHTKISLTITYEVLSMGLQNSRTDERCLKLQ